MSLDIEDSETLTSIEIELKEIARQLRISNNIRMSEYNKDKTPNEMINTDGELAEEKPLVTVEDLI